MTSKSCTSKSYFLFRPGTVQSSSLLIYAILCSRRFLFARIVLAMYGVPHNSAATRVSGLFGVSSTGAGGCSLRFERVVIVAVTGAMGVEYVTCFGFTIVAGCSAGLWALLCRGCF